MDILSRLVSYLSAGTLPSKRELLYLSARTYIGTDASPGDFAPDELGCAESVNDIYKRTFGKMISTRYHLSTYWMYADLKASAEFARTEQPLAGDIIISPTGYTKRNDVKNGHVGIVGENGVVMSNNSVTGKWDEHWTIDSWRRYYQYRGGYPVHFFRVV